MIERVQRGEKTGVPYKKMVQRYMDLVKATGWKFPKDWKIE